MAGKLFLEYTFIPNVVLRMYAGGEVFFSALFPNFKFLNKKARNSLKILGIPCKKSPIYS